MENEIKTKTVIVYDLSSIPEGWNLERVIKHYEDTGFLIYTTEKKEDKESNINPPNIIRVL